jgi:colanic acid biosynthesis glycosyl transferase WcaI
MVIYLQPLFSHRERPLRILILGLNFAPELIGVGRYTAELAQWLRVRGHQVRVVTAPPYYPAWRITRGYAGGRFQAEELAGIPLLRCPLWVPAIPTPARRVLHLLSFGLSSLLPCLWQALRWRPDVVWTVEPTACSLPAALLAARLAGAAACLHVQDLELEAAVSLRMLARSWLAASLRAGYAWLVRRFDLVSTISSHMHWQLALLGIAAERFCMFPNWVDTEAIRPLPGPSPLRQALGLADDRVVALYAGNMGEKQGVEVLLEVARRLLDCPRVQLVLAGDGALRPLLEQGVANLPNVTLLPLQPPERLNELLNLADLHLLPQRAEAGRFALPSKVGGMLASGRPVVVQALGGELAAATRDCGILLPPGDAAAMAAAVRRLAEDAGLRQRLGAAARRYAETHLARARILADYERELAERAALRATRQTWRERLRLALAAGRGGAAAPRAFGDGSRS